MEINPSTHGPKPTLHKIVKSEVDGVPLANPRAKLGARLRAKLCTGLRAKPGSRVTTWPGFYKPGSGKGLVPRPSIEYGAKRCLGPEAGPWLKTKDLA